ncbi:hypothetical protein QMTAC487_21920 [Sphaerotilus sp. FB-3]|nr:hypothetical protein QMTAC487_21920 [Sphaerotilus sp. FB-3]
MEISEALIITRSPWIEYPLIPDRVSDELFCGAIFSRAVEGMFMVGVAAPGPLDTSGAALCALSKAGGL